MIGQTAQPLYRDLRDPDGSTELLGLDRHWLGQRDDRSDAASCRAGRQLQQSLSGDTDRRSSGFPRSFGASIAEASLPGFRLGGDQRTRLRVPHRGMRSIAMPTGTEEDPIPVMIDQNTAMWSLQMTKGIGEKKAFEYRDGESITFEVVGLLSNSMLQGKLLIGENNFERVFPEVNGYRFFSVRAATGGS